jgi:hypothetical protein
MEDLFDLNSEALYSANDLDTVSMFSNLISYLKIDLS